MEITNLGNDDSKKVLHSIVKQINIKDSVSISIDYTKDKDSQIYKKTISIIIEK